MTATEEVGATNWRTAHAIDTFIAQCNWRWPHRSTASDGTLGDTRHQQETSGHNPNKYDVVRAFDCTEDPTHGADMNVLWHALAHTLDPRMYYMIWDRHIMDGKPGGNQPGVARTYSGDPHTNHLHISVGSDTYPYQGTGGRASLYDDPREWLAFLPSSHGAIYRRVLQVTKGQTEMTGTDVAALRAALGFSANGAFTTKVRDRLKSAQEKKGLTPDGVCGIRSWLAVVRS